MTAATRFHPLVKGLCLSATAFGLGLISTASQAIDSPALADFFVSSAQPTSSFHAWDAVLVNSQTEGFFEFEVAKVLPAGIKADQIGKVTLHLFQAWVDSPGSVEVIRVPGSFSETATTYSSRPAHTGRGSGVVQPLTGSQQPLFIDITAMFKAAVTEQAARLRVSVLPALATPTVAVQLYSKESGRQPAWLDITLATSVQSVVPTYVMATSTAKIACADVCKAAGSIAVANAAGKVCLARNGAPSAFETYVPSRYVAGNGSIGSSGSEIPYFYSCGPGADAATNATAQCVCQK